MEDMESRVCTWGEIKQVSINKKQRNMLSILMKWNILLMEEILHHLGWKEVRK